MEVSFRSGDLSRDSKTSLTLADLEEGQKVEGLVKKVEEYGLFISIEGSKLSGLCHKSEVCLQLLCSFLTNFELSFRTRKAQTLH